MQKIMVNRRAARYGQIRIHCNNRLKSEKFLQPVLDKVEPRHSAIHDNRINFKIFRAQFIGTFFQHVKNRENNISGVTLFSYFIQIFKIVEFVLDAHEFAPDTFNFLNGKSIVIRVTGSRNISTDKINFFLIFFIVPDTCRGAKISAFISAQFNFQSFSAIQKNIYKRLLLASNRAQNFLIIPILFKIALEHFFNEARIEIVAAKQRVAVNRQIFHVQNFRVIFASGNSVQSYIERSAAKVKNHHRFFAAQIQNLTVNFAIVNFVNEIVKNCLRFGKENLANRAVGIVSFNSCKLRGFKRRLTHNAVEAGGNRYNNIFNFFLPVILGSML